MCIFGVLVHAYKPNTHESQARGWEFEANLCQFCEKNVHTKHKL